MPETLKYLDDGLAFTVLGVSGLKLTEPQPVPETGVCYLSTPTGPRVVLFPVYDMPGTKPVIGEGLICTITPVPTMIAGKCADIDAIDAAAEGDEDFEDEDDEDEDDDTGEDDDGDDEGDEELEEDDAEDARG